MSPWWLWARAWYLGALSWWGGALGRTRWLALSFENQSGPLMAAVGLVGGAIAVAQRGWVRWVGVALAAGGLSGAWLSGSRGTVVLLVPVLVLVAVAAGRQEGLRATAVGVTASLVAALLVTVALTSLPGSATAGTTAADRASGPPADGPGDTSGPVTDVAGRSLTDPSLTWSWCFAWSAGCRETCLPPHRGSTVVRVSRG